MPRTYAIKGPDRLGRVISVPMNDATVRALRERSRETGVSVAETIRRFVRQGLDQERAA